MEADDGYEPSPDEIVTCGYVHTSLSRLVIAKLQDAGIRAEATEQRAGYGAPVKSRIVCFADQRDEAVAIIDEFFGQAGDRAELET
jgi:hypothetical protein